jgi:hypothetical protein
VVQFYDSLSFSVYVRLKFRGNDKIMARKGLGKKRLLINRRTTPEYGEKEINAIRVVGGRAQAEGQCTDTSVWW